MFSQSSMLMGAKYDASAGKRHLARADAARELMRLTDAIKDELTERQYRCAEEVWGLGKTSRAAAAAIGIHHRSVDVALLAIAAKLRGKTGSK